MSFTDWSHALWKVRHSDMAANPFKFLQEVRQETAKVTWPTRRETMISTIMVLIMVVLASTFFFTVDQIFSLIFDFVFGV